jgi:multidrug efflux pump subunit AcrB
VPLVAETTIIAAPQRQIGLSASIPPNSPRAIFLQRAFVPMLLQANKQFSAGGSDQREPGSDDRDGRVPAECGRCGQRGDRGVSVGKPVYLREVADLVDGAERPGQYVLYGSGHRSEEDPAVTLAVAKRPGANAISVAREVLRKVDSLKGREIPEDVSIAITRNYGETGR